MPRYHVNRRTGEPGRCRAMVACPFGSLDDDHYSTKAEARAAYEKSMERSQRPVVIPPRPSDSRLAWDSTKDLQTVLEGKSVEMVNLEKGTLRLSDGTVLRVNPNEGCGGCSSGWYDLETLESVPNIITRAEVATEELEKWGEKLRYRIFVFAEDKRLTLATVKGDDGNGYYGTGFTLDVWLPES